MKWLWLQLGAGMTLITLGLITEVPAQNMCAPLPQMLKFLSEAHGEVVMFHGDIQNGLSMRFAASPGGSWTALIVKDDIACMRLSGTELTPGPVLEETGDPS